MMNMSPTPSKILIIESDLAMLELYGRELSPHFDVLTCSKKSDMLSIIQAQRVSAVVLEPDAWSGQGWDLLDSLLALPADVYSFPVILCSVLDERKRGLEKGAAVFLVKPVLPSQLLKTLRQLINSR
jgi:DNA-binding response OmpR family regulator